MTATKWIVTNALALGVANATVPAVFRLAWQAGAADTMIALWVGLWWGLVIGVAQVWALRPVRGILWVASAMAVLSAGWLWTVMIRPEDILGTASLLDQARDAALFGALIGGGIGAAQWMLARQNLGSAQWIVRAALGWALVMVVLNVGEGVVGPTEGAAHVAVRGLLGLVGGALLGAVAIVRRDKPSALTG
jgi:hypothetical protein